MVSFRDAPVRTTPDDVRRCPVAGSGSPPRHHCRAWRRTGTTAPHRRTLRGAAPGALRWESGAHGRSGMRRFSAPWKAGIASPALPRGDRRRGGRCPPAPADKRGTGGAADEAHQWGPVAESSAQNGVWQGQRVPAVPYLRAGGRLPAARSLRAAGGAWSCLRERRAFSLPAAARQGQRQRRRLGSDGLSSVPGASRGSGDNGTARRGIRIQQPPNPIRPPPPGPARPAETECPLRAALPASPPTGIRYPPAPVSLIYNFSTPRRAPLHPPAHILRREHALPGTRPPPARSPARRPAGTVSLSGGSPGAGRPRPPGIPAVPSRRSPALRCLPPQRCGAGSGTRRWHAAGLPCAGRAADLRFLDQMLSGGVPVLPSPSPASQENLDSAASRHRLLSRGPGLAGAIIYSRSPADGRDARNAPKRCPRPRGPGLRSPPSLGRGSRGADRSVWGLTQTSTGLQTAALRAFRAGKPGRGSTG